ncbi:ShlB/FhaC/HecB family hemolysin secretion/activation protein [Marinomonas sp.]|uniref:ShlB/FhaC/HecB family hemolysin secretion/activation protein n=1 Tax=Marinomonas sp. TaxID=1904862 RepID=UPI003BA85A65
MKPNKYCHFAPALALSGVLGFMSSFAFSETAGQLTQPSYAPDVIRQVPGGFEFPALSTLSVPKGAENLKVTPSGLVIEGQLKGVEEQTDKIEAGIKNKQISGVELFEAAQKLESAYVQAGYVLARVSLPPQTIKDGLPLRLVVTNGFVESIDASAFYGVTKQRIEAVLQPLVGKMILLKRELERRLLLAGDIPGVSLRSTLKAGDKPGATMIIVDGRYDPVSLTASVNNSLSDGVGNYGASVGANFNNTLGLGEAGYFQLGGYFGTENSVFSGAPRNRQIVAGFNLPLSIDGAWMNAEVVSSQTHPTTDVGYTVPDDYQRFSTKLGYHWVRSRNLNTSSVLGLDLIDEKLSLDLQGVRENWKQDKVSILRLTQNVDMYTHSNGFLSGEITASFGVDGIGARSPTSALKMSRDGAEPEFKKLAISANYQQGFKNTRLQLSLSGKAQTSMGDTLISSEEFSLGGFDWISAFEGGVLMGDSGAVVRGELSLPLLLPETLSLPGLASNIVPYVYGAAGAASIEKPTAAEDKYTNAKAFGIGLRIGDSKADSAFNSSLALEYAHGNRSDGPTDGRFNFRWYARF